ncbi:MAG: PA0069 family radical SAM protein [Flavobacteriales bacterium]|nr:PA0069 family radical SAM protein [Flavobacteriales bacterium]
MITGRGSSINSNNRFAQHQYSADEGERLEDVGIGQSKFIEIFPKTIVNPVISPDVPLKWSLNPYQGCEHGCTYCYARPTHEYWGYSGGVDFEQTILVKKNAAELLRKKFDSKNWKGEAIMFSGNTDCYQPIERKLQITRQLLEVCNQYKNPVGIITKNSLVARDIDILGEMASRNQVQVVLSITSLQEKVRRILEPRTASVKSKLQTIEQLSAAKIPVAVIMAPIIPAITSHEIMDMAKAVSKAGATSLSYTIVRLNGCVEELFTDWLGRHFLDRKNKVLTQIADCHGGSVQDQRFKTRMKGEGNFAELIHQQFKLACKKYNLNKQELPLNETAFHRFNAQTSLNF